MALKIMTLEDETFPANATCKRNILAWHHNCFATKLYFDKVKWPLKSTKYASTVYVMFTSCNHCNAYSIYAMYMLNVYDVYTAYILKIYNDIYAAYSLNVFTDISQCIC